MHTRLEDLLSHQYFDGEGMGREKFTDLLCTFYGLYKPLEEELAPAVRRHLEDFSYELRSSRLRQDLKTLGFTEESLDELPKLSAAELVRLDGTHEVLGCLYVVEGSELGGSVIRRQLKKSLSEESLKANAYYRDKPEETRRKWTNFCSLFNTRVNSKQTLATATTTAKETFRMYEGWIS